MPSGIKIAGIIAGTILFLTICEYLLFASIGSFVNLNLQYFNPEVWTEGWRVGAAAVFIFIFVLTILFTLVSNLG